MRLRPCIDIHGGAVKQIVGGSLSGEKGSARENYVAAQGAAYFAALYREKNLPGGHIINLTRPGEPGYEESLLQMRQGLGAWPGGMMAGGGITPDNASACLAAGASHCIVTSFVFRDGRLDRERLEMLEGRIGRERLVLDLSCRRGADGRYWCVTDRWQKFTELAVTEETLKELSGHCAEFLIHAADVEGKRGGIEEELVEILGRFALESGFPVTYAGGVHALSDIRRMRAVADNVDVTVGSALDLFGGSLSLEELAAACRE